MSDALPHILVLDAMGVIYPFADDVVELLIPFIKEKGGTQDELVIQQMYRAASLGRMASFQFWEKVGLKHSCEDEYLGRFVLADGLLELLHEAGARSLPVWCLSNDVSEWSRKLRERFELTRHMQGFLISGDVMVRKPDPAIYKFLVKAVDADARQMLFVDDRPANLDTAAGLGFATVQYRPPAGNIPAGNHRIVSTFREILGLVK